MCVGLLAHSRFSRHSGKSNGDDTLRTLAGSCDDDHSLLPFAGIERPSAVVVVAVVVVVVSDANDPAANWQAGMRTEDKIEARFLGCCKSVKQRREK